ncbi:AMP-binding protein [Marinithermus hydrothermalis]|uniref:acetate--CoA ligase n=1 Tax=Marinithermus hydrothermalis (strain DSM 14884 / JCM 11576 / T1) TaxID=869210 RepID=F2NQX1_MARHT|nr:AMP-binding protein [Marinithermus hydrothermalis]AEB12549.1 transcriptional regulator, IclR family [Marinithermus hydrothermalis DSM 14884]
MGRSRRRSLSTVQAALRVLAYLAAHPEGLEAAQVARMLGKSLSAAYALLNSLVQEGFAEHDPARATYRLAGALVPLPPEPAPPAYEGLEEALEEVYLRTRERAYLGVWRRGRLCFSTRGRQGLVKPPGLEGEVRAGLHALALGKAVLAHLGEEAVGAELEAYTPYTVTDPVALGEELERVRRVGFAVELEEYALGMCGVAAPVFGPGGEVLGALGVVVPARRFPYAFSRVARAVCEVAQAASKTRRRLPAGVVRREARPRRALPRPARPLPEGRVWAPKALRRTGSRKDYEAAYRRSLEDPEGFWGAWAERFEWHRPWTRVLEGTPPECRWFVGGATNIVQNALDRHARSSRRNQLALVAYAGDGRVEKLSYRELHDRVARFAAALQARGVGVGDRVALHLPTGLEAVIAMLAAARIGAVHVFLPVGLGAAALRDRLEDTGARLLIAADRVYQGGRARPLAGLVEEAVAGLELEVIWHRRGAGARGPEFWEVLEGMRVKAPVVPVDADHPLFILYTSGSTGKPKGVVHAHGGYMVGVTYFLRRLFGLEDGEVFWATADLGWIVGHSYGVYAPLLEGLTTVLREERLDHPDPGAFYEVLEAAGVNVLLTSPAWLRALRRYGAEWGRDADLALRLVASVGEHLAPEVWHWVHAHLGVFVLDNWWQTETGAPALATPLALPARPGRVGVPLEGVEARVVDAEGRELPPGEKGFLVLKRPFPHFMRALWNNPEGYRALWARFGGYFTGDFAVRDAEGYFTVLGRSDDVIKVGDQRVGTAEIEDVLLSYPAVAEAAAVGVPDPERGEVVKAYVVLRFKEATPEVHEVLASKLKAHVRRHLGELATPAEVVFLDRLPRTKSGKILRRLLRAWELGHDPGDLSTLEA